jgi:hypothetical protein
MILLAELGMKTGLKMYSVGRTSEKNSASDDKNPRMYIRAHYGTVDKNSPPAARRTLRFNIRAEPSSISTFLNDTLELKRPPRRTLEMF